ncbi:MAG: hypothetical protein A2556_02295 [Candidatus Vogelbacteria bacterium RIFOXYD2_FULL_44_9]|uniref:Uncharacterized protein n=1 Tax=Candidatus Vogelbacteria bacterium RIFOXYD2_FULL_44_9 TaxID=1802441 RepID=A0A1G2QLX7_9BACT|nr:MAG: hypothetical protein A2556_02295 [Candidatus Vogelbacteria bacterium RIFOXYD2_FULL_44_9]
MFPVLTKADDLEGQLRQAIQSGDFDEALSLERKLERPLRVHDELEPLAATLLLRGDYPGFRRVIDLRAINFFNEEGARRILARCTL